MENKYALWKRLKEKRRYYKHSMGGDIYFGYVKGITLQFEDSATTTDTVEGISAKQEVRGSMEKTQKTKRMEFSIKKNQTQSNNSFLGIRTILHQIMFRKIKAPNGVADSDFFVTFSSQWMAQFE